ncbi:DUF418 domain-containing protein [Spirosoma arcticum]
MESLIASPAEHFSDQDQRTDHIELTRTDAGPDTRPTALNVLWGVAVLGLLVVSIRAFGLTQAQVSQLVRGPHGGNYWLLKLTHILLDNTLPALVALLFGAGILLFMSTPNASGSLATTPADRAPVNRQELYIRRQLWLGAFAVVNAFVLLSPVDWLFQLAVVGLLLFALQRLSARALLIGAVVTGLIFSGKGYWNYTEQRAKFTKYEQVVALEKKNKKVKLTDEQKDDKSTWEGMIKSVAYDKKKDRADVIALRSDYSIAWNFLLRPLQARHAGQFYRLGIWEIISMVLLGMALFRWGFFTNQLKIGQYAAVAAIGLAVGQTLAWLSWPSYELKLVDFTKLISTNTLPLSDLLQPVERAFSAVGLAGVVMLLHRASRGAWFGRVGPRQVVGAVGQLALTNYLVQTVLCAVFFYGYGFGYFGDLRLQTLYIVVAEIWLLQVVFSMIWLRYFRIGPAEWLWQSLTYGRRLSIRHPEPTPVLS